MSKFKSLQDRFNHLRNNVGFPVTLWEEFIQDCLIENSRLKKVEDRVLELEHALAQVVTLAERDSDTFGKARSDIAARAKENL